ncbi:hypothetical protein PACTADRAFT_48031 [Pachysolen tannophilus NRRL Y-2460]|uniref:Shr3 amino acid permease chaperone n=1 Tax=Pachysolen tannophilus NRRL Y-2460 TaxID=669874 RepID=A0A1E4U2K6_PACTA|nr:hypothetical protein PACTADRAFT_48031 [Pachysolen tannophilus NRRL Y-2460]
MAYKDIVPVGTTLIVAATSFALGVIFSNWPYDYSTLYSKILPTDKTFANSLQHYQTLGSSPLFIVHTFHAVLGIGFIGCFIKIYKPSEETKLFEYGTLFLYMVAVVVYLTNIRIGIQSAIARQWGDVDEKTGINVIAASQTMIVFVLVGVLVLQGGLYYANWENERALKKFYEDEAKEKAKKQEQQDKESGVDSAKASGSEVREKTSSGKKSIKKT